MTPVHFYLLGTATWFFSFGIQSVVFTWLVTIYLRESADLVGIAQMCFLLPAMFFMLLGGSLADRYGGRRVAMVGQLFAATTPAILIFTLLTDTFSYPVLLVFAVLMGCAQALVTPARDGLLAHLAGGRIQRLVVRTSMIQFGIQMFGFIVASTTESIGPVPVLIIQSVSLALGVVAYRLLRYEHTPVVRQAGTPLVAEIASSIGDGFRSVATSPAMRVVVIQNCAMGVFFMGSYIVTLPLLLRELYDGSSQELSWMNAANSLGLFTTILLLMRVGDITRQGRALLLTQGIGAVVLASAGLGLGFPLLVVSLFCWGMCGGIAMTMSRTIMQEQSPPEQRARMMAFYSFSFMGSGPIGALLSGYLVEWLGPVAALTISSSLMLIVVLAVAMMSGLWHLDHKHEEHHEQTR